MIGRPYEPVPGTLLHVETLDFSVRNHVQGQLAHLRTRGLTPHVAAGDTGDLAAFGRDEGVPVHALPATREPDPKQDVATLRALRRVIAEVRPEAIYYATPKAALLGALAAREQGVPLRFYGRLGLRQETLAGWKHGAFGQVERLISGLSTDTICVGPSVLRRSRELGILPGGRGTVLGHGSVNGIDADRFRPDPQVRARQRAELGFTDDDLVIGFIGRLARDKGVAELLSAFTTLREQDPRWKLLAVGPVEGVEFGPDTDAGRLLAGPDCRQIGWTDDPVPLLLASDVVCLPSYREGLSNTLLEAGACGLPCVSTDATGIQDVIVAERTGLIVPVRDAGALAGALARLADPALRQRLGAAARAHVVEHFDQHTVWENWARYYLGRMGRPR